MSAGLATALQRVKELVAVLLDLLQRGRIEECRICRDPRRLEESICVVEEPKDVVAIERTGGVPGRYHVLGGAIKPLEGVGPDNLRIRELLTRLASGAIKELILATDPNTEGEATATYLAIMIKRWASGHPPRQRSFRWVGEPRVRRRDHSGPRLRGSARRLEPRQQCSGEG